jgi:hypothetical protein
LQQQQQQQLHHVTLQGIGTIDSSTGFRSTRQQQWAIKAQLCVIFW